MRVSSRNLDELMAPENISASNQMQQAWRYYKLDCDLMDILRRPARIVRGLQTCLNCRICEFLEPDVQFGIQESLTLKLMSKSHTISNHNVLGLVEKIRRLSLQWDWPHIQLKSESTRIYETSRVSRTCPSVVTPYFSLWAMYHVRAQ
jgi:hypothetical protein